ncbi:MAG TPA: 16S rRNA (cytosine(1402)-N(4))-methyltransferase RsmH [Candidatus Onthousia faecavium]|nr:16S rRNA (cytosine(1402)-N(4))-methyltransferase RsmH [Candidatus Onthousia faecavium]
MHESVLLNEVIDALNLKEDSIVVDMTLGFAGHSSEILKRIKKGRLIAFDQDEEALKYSREKLKKIGNNFDIIDSNFVYLKENLEKLNISGVDAILYDLGVSSPQLDEDYRGFSYHQDAPLDMRMDQDNPLTAGIIVNTYSYQDLKKIFKDYGESKFASNIALSIVKYRETKEIKTTLELVDIIKSAVPYKEKIKKHPAKQIFQALRIEVNKELEVLEKSLDDALSLLNVGGRIAVITFQSLEDKIVKNKFRCVSEIDQISRGLPNVPKDKLPDFKLITKKGIKPSQKELEQNRRAHSATLRVIEKVK